MLQLSLFFISFLMFVELTFSMLCVIYGIEISLSAKEFDILEYLASRYQDIALSEDVVEHVYDKFFDPFSSVLRAHIANLRKKLTATGGKGLLITVKGKGYRLCE